MSHHGAWMRCHASTITRIAMAQTALRHHQRRIPAATKKEKIMLSDSSQRHGNCMNSIFGRIFHSMADTGNMSTLPAAAQTSRAFQKSRWASRQLLVVQIVKKITAISKPATQDMMWLKLS